MKRVATKFILLQVVMSLFISCKSGTEPNTTEVQQSEFSESGLQMENIEIVQYSTENSGVLVVPVDNGLLINPKARLSGKSLQSIKQLKFDRPRLDVPEIILFDDHDTFQQLKAKYAEEEVPYTTNSFSSAPEDFIGKAFEQYQANTFTSKTVLDTSNSDKLFAIESPANNTTSDVTIGVEGSSVERYVANDDMPVFASPDFSSNILISLARGSRVYVLDSIPVQVGNTIFAEVQVADDFPYPTGYMPIH